VKRLSLADPVILASGWHRMLIAFLAGAASTLALPPVNVWPAMFVTFPLLVWLLDGVKATRWPGVRTTFAIGWWFGFGYFLAGLYWIGAAFLVDAKTFGWLMPFAVTALPAGMAVYTAAGFVTARFLWTPGPFRILTFAATLSTAEWLRGHLFTGFPWNTFGYALTAPLPLAESAALFGVWGLTFVAVAVFAAPAMLADGMRRGATAVAIASSALAALAAYGASRLADNPTEMVEGVHLRIMQPNVPQDDRFTYGARTPIMKRYVDMSQGGGAADRTPVGLNGVTHLIWPESAFPFFLIREPDALAAIAAMLPPETSLIVGAARPADPRYFRERIAPVLGRDWHAYNSVYVIDHTGSIRATYDKMHLVPFGEYLPFEHLLTRMGLTQLTGVPGGFLPGRERRRIAIAGGPDMLPLVCYEAIFPGAAVPDGERPGWLLNLTNDAWFGISAGPYQHFQQARVRAIEEGLPLIRAANSGISAVIDPVGRVVASLPLGYDGLLDSALPKPAQITIYARMGDLLFIIAISGVLTVGVFYRVMRELRKRYTYT
jgi:apolipoprotein N-acyltransferase